MWTSLAYIEPVKGTDDKLIQMITPNVTDVADELKRRIKASEVQPDIQLYAKSLEQIMEIIDGNRETSRQLIKDLVKNQQKAVHPFPRIDKTLPIADWNDPMWATEGLPRQVVNYYPGRFRDCETILKNLKVTEKERKWIQQHALWLYEKKMSSDPEEPVALRSKLEAYELCIQCKTMLSSTYYETDSEDSDSLPDPVEEIQGTPGLEEYEPTIEEYTTMPIVEDAPNPTATTSRPRTRGQTRLLSRNFPEPTTMSDIEDAGSDEGVDHHQGRRATSTPSDTA